MNTSLRFTLLFTAALASAHAAEFSFNAVLRAGGSGTDASGWEVGVGPITAPTSGLQYEFNGATDTWSDNRNQSFRIGYTQSTNSAYVTVFGQGGSPSFTTAFNPANSFPTSASQSWTIYASVDAQMRPVRTRVTVDDLSLQTGLNILAPLSPTTLTATQRFSSGSDSLSAPLVFRTDTTGGDWYIDGTIRFNGLEAYTPLGASNENLRFSLSAIAADSPEPLTSMLCFCGLLGLAAYRKYHTKKSPILAAQNSNLCEPYSSSLP